MNIANKATRIDLFNFSTRPMRAFHLTWISFFLCFFAWFGIAPLMPIIRDELGLTKFQIGNTIIASVAATILIRPLVGHLCDRFGPRLTYTWLLVLCSLPVMGIGLANSYESFLLFRLGIGAIGASFVVTQYHTSVMFAPNCVGTANATVAGWGNLGGGITQMIMPLIFAGFVGLGYTESISWRLSMVLAGILCLISGLAYYYFTTDYPNGNLKDLEHTLTKEDKENKKGTFLLAAKDYRVWVLFLLYAACFGIEITINNIAALYFVDYFGLGLKTAGLVAGMFGLMNLFARSLGGIIGDKIGHKNGLKGRIKWLFWAACFEGLALMLFSRMTYLPFAIGSMVLFSLFVQMTEGATYSVVPFISRRALGSVSGIVAAGGNIGAVAAGFLFRTESITWPTALLIVGAIVFLSSFLTLAIKFSKEEEAAVNKELQSALKERLNYEASIIPVKKPSLALPDFVRSFQPIDALRVFLGGALAIKGVYFVLNFDQIERMAESIGNFQHVSAWYVTFAHLAGGICIMIGLGTRYAIAANIPVLLGAIFFVHAKSHLFGEDLGLRLSVFVFVTLIIMLWNGSGIASVDNYLKNSAEKK